MSQLRSPEQQSRKMLNEEKMIIDLELAIKKEQFKKSQKPKRELYKVTMEDKDSQMDSVSINGTNLKINHVLNFLLTKLGFDNGR